MPDRWDAACEQTFLESRKQAEGLKHTWLGTEHVALAMLVAPGSQLAGKLRALQREPRALYERIVADLKEVVAPDLGGGLPLTPRMRQVVAVADSLATDDKRPAIEEPHLLQALLEGGPGVFIRAMLKWGVEPGEVMRAAVVAPPATPTIKTVHATAVDAEVEPDPKPKRKKTSEERPPQPKPKPAPIIVPVSHNPALLNFGIVAPPPTVSQTPRLDKVGRDLTAQARAGRFDDLVPRPILLAELELDMCRSGRGATVLVGPSGCGKTALLELLALKIVRREGPSELTGARVVEMAAVDVLSPDFEALLSEVSGHNIVLVLDEFHRPGYAAIKHVLETATMLLLGTCSPDAYNDFIAAEASLKRRLRVLDVPATSHDETLAILRTRVPDWSRRHHVTVTDEALEAVWKAHRHVELGTMPDLALDLLEESCLRARQSKQAVGPQVVADVLQRRAAR